MNISTGKTVTEITSRTVLYLTSFYLENDILDHTMLNDN